MPDTPITKDLISPVTPDSSTDLFTIGDAPSGTWGKFTVGDLLTLVDGASTFVNEEFTLSAAQAIVNLANTPTRVISVDRNGLAIKETTDYTIVGTVLTLVEAAGSSTGATGNETLSVKYYY